MRCEALVNRTFDLFPDAGERESAQFWTGLRPATPSNVPLVGGTRYRNLFLDTGHGTLGWTMACGSGRALADVIARTQAWRGFCIYARVRPIDAWHRSCNPSIAGQAFGLHLVLSALIAATVVGARAVRCGIRALLQRDGRRNAAAPADRRRRGAGAAHHAHHLRSRQAAPAGPRDHRGAAGRGARLRQLRDVRGAPRLQRVRQGPLRDRRGQQHRSRVAGQGAGRDSSRCRWAGRASSPRTCRRTATRPRPS